MTTVLTIGKHVGSAIVGLFTLIIAVVEMIKEGKSIKK